MRKLKKSYRFTFLLIGFLIGVVAIWVVLHQNTFHFDNRRYPIFGIDVSKHNGKIEWDRVRETGVDFVFVKATEGISMVDPTFKANIEGARRIGAKVGAYHFFKFNRDGLAQAQFFLGRVKPYKFDLPLAIDVEEHSNRTNRNRPQVVIKEIKRFIAEVESRTGQKVLIYTNEHEYGKYIKGNFTQNPLWVCFLEQEVEIDRPWRFWQYTHRGEVAGINGKVDLNTFNGGAKEWGQYTR